MQIDMFADTACPWSYVGKRRLEQALRLRRDAGLRLRFRPLLLDSALLERGMDRRSYELQWASDHDIGAVDEQLRIVGRAVDIEFRFDLIRRRPSTIDSHRLLHWAESAGLQAELLESLFRRYFCQGEDIGETAVLLAAASEVGMNMGLVMEMLASEFDRDFVSEASAAAIRAGVDGTPTLLLDHRWLFAGAGSVEQLLTAIDWARGRQLPASN